MLRIGLQAAKRPALRAARGTQQVRFASVHYGPEEPLTPYVRWVGGVALAFGLVIYDRFYSDGAITKLITPHNDNEAAIEARDAFVDKARRDQESAITLFNPRGSRVPAENYSVQPVPTPAYRSAYQGGAVDLETLSPRRQRTQTVAAADDDAAKTA